MLSSDKSNPAPETPTETLQEPPLEPHPFAWGALQTVADVAEFLGARRSDLAYWLYTAPPDKRYTEFEIPKRTGGMRLISAPTDQIKTWQNRVAEKLAQSYRPHPSAHGFLEKRSVLTNAWDHTGVRFVLNVDLKDFFPSINFGRVRGLFIKPPFAMAPPAATVLAQLCTFRNGLPQGAPTSPILSNFVASELDRRLTRLAKSNGVAYSRYADDISFSCNRPEFPPDLAHYEVDAGGLKTLRLGAALAKEISAAGFAPNLGKLRLQTRAMRQAVTGLTVNAKANVQRRRIRRVRAMLHAWEKFGLQAAGQEHFSLYRPSAAALRDPGPRFRHGVYGQLSFIKMVRGVDDPLFLKLCARVLDLDPNPSRFLKKMVFGDELYDVFISHASEDKDAIARPIAQALARQGLKAFLDEAHIGWGENFTKKINTALGASRYVLAIVSSHSVTKDWPILELNAALAMEANGLKTVIPVVVGKPDLGKLPLLQAKDWYVWKDDVEALALRVRQVVKGELRGAARRQAVDARESSASAVPTEVAQGGTSPPVASSDINKKPGFFARLFRKQ